MTAWRPGMACLVRGEWPAYVRAVDDRGRATVLFLGAPPEGYVQPAVVAVAALTRPSGARYLDRRGSRPWTTKQPWDGEVLRTLRREWPRRARADVARMVGRSEDACKIAFTRWWGSMRAVAGRAPVLSLRAVARLLAVDDHRVAYLIDRGYLRAAKSGIRAGANERWAVTEADLGTFLERYQEHYDWRRMPDSPHRRYAARLAAADPLLTVDEVAARVYLAPEIVRAHLRSGRIPAVRSSGGAANSSYRWLVRASALVGFVVRGSGEVVGERIRAAVHARGLLTATEAARRLRLNRSTVSRYVREGRLAAERVDVGGRWVYGIALPATTDRSAERAA